MISELGKLYFWQCYVLTLIVLFLATLASTFHRNSVLFFFLIYTPFYYDCSLVEGCGNCFLQKEKDLINAQKQALLRKM